MLIRPAIKGDETSIMKLIQALAEYERAADQVSNTAEELGKHLFEEKICDALVVQSEDQIVGFALYYTSYSTWKGKCLYLEDFFILPEYRRHGTGSILFDEVLKIAKQRGARRLEWQVLDWNELALNFYKKKNSELDPEWINGRIILD